jgi:hypothetical protein
MTRTHTLRLIAGGLAAATTLSLAGATAAHAAPGTNGATMARLKAAGDTAITARLAVLQQLSGEVNGAKHLSAGDVSTLLGQISADTSGLTQLKTTIDAETNGANLVTELKSIVTSYRVYVEMVPKVHLVRAADWVVDVTTTITNVEPKLQAAISAKGNPSAAVAAYSDLVTKVSAAEGLASGLTGQLEGLTPAEYPSPAQTTLHGDRQALGTAANDLKQARADLQIIRNALKNGNA